MTFESRCGADVTGKKISRGKSGRSIVIKFFPSQTILGISLFCECYKETQLGLLDFFFCDVDVISKHILSDKSRCGLFLDFCL